MRSLKAEESSKIHRNVFGQYGEHSSKTEKRNYQLSILSIMHRMVSDRQGKTDTEAETLRQ
jgi:hypothetical protein